MRSTRPLLLHWIESGAIDAERVADDGELRLTSLHDANLVQLPAESQ